MSKAKRKRSAVILEIFLSKRFTFRQTLSWKLASLSVLVFHQPSDKQTMAMAKRKIQPETWFKTDNMVRSGGQENSSKHGAYGVTEVHVLFWWTKRSEPISNFRRLNLEILSLLLDLFNPWPGLENRMQNPLQCTGCTEKIVIIAVSMFANRNEISGEE